MRKNGEEKLEKGKLSSFCKYCCRLCPFLLPNNSDLTENSVRLYSQHVVSNDNANDIIKQTGKKNYRYSMRVENQRKKMLFIFCIRFDFVP